VADGVDPGGVRLAGMIAEYRTDAVEQEAAAVTPAAVDAAVPRNDPPDPKGPMPGPAG
jgi:hypothetical protein